MDDDVATDLWNSGGRQVVGPDDTSSLQPGPDREFVDAAVAGATDGLDRSPTSRPTTPR